MSTDYQVSFNELPIDRNYVTEELKITLTSQDGRIISSKSPKNYKPTNHFLNTLHEDEKFREFIVGNYTYDGICHWQFFFSYVWPYFFFCIECADLLNNLAKNYEITTLSFKKKGSIYYSVFSELLCNFCKTHNISLTVESTEKSFSLKFYQYFRRIVGTLYSQIKFFVLLVYFRRWFSNDKQNKKSVLIFSHASNLEESDGKIIDRQVNTIYQKLLHNFNPILVFSGINDLSILLKSDTISHLNYNAFCYFCDPFAFVKARFLYYRRLFLPKKVVELHDIYYGEVNIKNFIQAIFGYIEKYIFRETIFCRVACKRLVEKFEPKVIYLTYETGPVQRAAIIEAARKGIPTYGLQHGSIFSNAPDYMHSLVTQEYGQYGFNIPNKFFVWGNFWKNVITDHGKYPTDAVIVSGSWKSRNLVIPKNNKKQNKENILILLSRVQSEKFLHAVINSLKHMGKYSLFYRPHPSDKELLKKLTIGLNGINLIEGSIEDALEIADVVISPVSTVILDAVYAKKLVILYDHVGNQGWDEFENIEGIFYAETAEDLEKILEMVINLSEEEISLLQKKLEKYSQEFYKGDQYSALDVILSPLKSQNEPN